MSHIASFMGKPLVVSDYDSAIRYALGQAATRVGDLHFTWTGTGKLTHIERDGRSVFTGWEVQEVRAI